MRVTDKMTADSAIYNINSGKIKLNRLNEQLTSNLNINRPSDDPISARQIMDMEAQVNSTDQYMSNIGNGQTWTNVANTALQGMNDSISQAKSAAANIFAGMNDSVSVSNTLATLENVRQQIIDMVNVQVGDQYVFGGFDASTPVVSNKTMTGAVTKPLNQISGLNTVGPPPLAEGMPVTGPGVPANTVITSVPTSLINPSPPGTVFISNNLTKAVASGSFTFGVAPLPARADTGGALPTITGLNTVGPPALTVGMTISGPGIPPNTTITNIVNGTDINISNNPTAPTSAGSYVFQAPQVTNNANGVAQRLITGINTAGLNPGDTVSGVPSGPNPSGPGIPLGTTITSIVSPTSVAISSDPYWNGGPGDFSFNGGPTQSGLTNESLITGFASTVGLAVGMTISGPGVPPNTTITNIVNGTDITVSGLVNTGALSGTYTFDSPAITQAGGTAQQSQIQGLVPPPLLASGTADLAVGMTVSGTGVPPNTTITSIVNGTDITLSNALTATGLASISFDPIINRSGTVNTAQPNQITGLATTIGLSVGMSVSGAGVPANTLITVVNALAGTVTLSDTVTQAGTSNFAFGQTVSTQTANTDLPPNQITGLSSTANLYVGMKISGPGIPDNTTITAINNGTDITISNVPTQTGVNNYVFEGYINSSSSRTVTGATTLNSSTVTVPSTAKLAAGMLISGPGIPPSTTIASIVNGTDITLSANATATSTGVPLTITAVGAAQTVTATGTTTTVAGTTTLNSATVTLADTTGLMAGTGVTGAGIPAGTTILSVDNATQITLTANSTAATGPYPLTFADNRGTTTNLSPIVTLPSTANLKPGTSVSGTGIPAGTTILTVDGPNQITLTANSTAATGPYPLTFTDNRGTTIAGSNTITGILSTAGLSSGMIVTGAGIPSSPPTTIVSIAANGTDITLSAPATATAPVDGTPLGFYTPGYFADDAVNININRSSQVALNYSGAKLLLGGTPAAPSQASGPPPSNLPINILGTIGELINAINNKDSAGVQAASSNLKAATDQINLAQSEYASRSIRLDSAKTMLTNNQGTLKNIISNKQNVDYAKTIIELQQQTTAYQAALQATAKITPLSLMDYLK